MIGALAKAFAQLSDPGFRRALAWGLGGAALLYAGLYSALAWGLAQMQVFQAGWANGLVQAASGVVVVLVSLLMFPTVALAVMELLADDVAAAVDARHFPGLPPARHPSWPEAAATGLRLVGASLGWNLAVLPLYVVPPVGLAAGVALNAYLNGRAYFELAALRRMPAPQARALWRRRRLTLWAAGVPLAALSLAPLANLLVPVVGTAFMVHVVERLRQDFQ